MAQAASLTAGLAQAASLTSGLAQAASLTSGLAQPMPKDHDVGERLNVLVCA